MAQAVAYFKSKKALSYQRQGSLGQVYLFKLNEPVAVRLEQDISLFRSDTNLIETTSTGEPITTETDSEQIQPLSHASVRVIMDKGKDKSIKENSKKKSKK
ncbi:MAG: hypothetical protein AB1349_01565 [Elusimicrobiota bacterium]